MSLKLFDFRVTNMRTKESTGFLGQGKSVDEAFKDGVANARSSHPKYGDTGVKVTTKSGRIVSRPLRDFEGDVAWGEPTPAPAAETTAEIVEVDL